MKTLYQFKLHLFYKHQDDRVQSAYLQGFEALIGSTVLGKIRRNMLQRITEGRWQEHLLVMMN